MFCLYCVLTTLYKLKRIQFVHPSPHINQFLPNPNHHTVTVNLIRTSGISLPALGLVLGPHWSYWSQQGQKRSPVDHKNMHINSHTRTGYVHVLSISHHILSLPHI